MTTIIEARAIADRLINQHTKLKDDELVIVDSSTLEKRTAWVFFWNSKKYIETEDIQYAFGGNAPVLVYKETGQARFLGTAQAPEFYLREMGID
jgi:hypothetical protein